jgi:hypothetical protein
MRYFQEFTDFLQKHDIEPPKGNSLKEISELQTALGCELPEAYKEYLLLMGKDYEGVMVGTNCFLTDVKSNNEYLPELLEENNLSEFTLPEKYVAFFCHQGYMMAWFSIPSNETDPICTYYFEGTIERPKEYGTFSEFMKKDLMGNAKLTIENRRYKKLRRKWWQFRK